MSTPRALYTRAGLYTQKVSSLPCAGRHVFYQRLTPFDMGRVSQVCLIEHSRNPQAPSSPELPTGLHPQHSTHNTVPSPCSQNLLHPLWPLVDFSGLPMRTAKEQTGGFTRGPRAVAPSCMTLLSYPLPSHTFAQDGCCSSTHRLYTSSQQE